MAGTKKVIDMKLLLNSQKTIDSGLLMNMFGLIVYKQALAHDILFFNSTEHLLPSIIVVATLLSLVTYIHAAMINIQEHIHEHIMYIEHVIVSGIQIYLYLYLLIYIHRMVDSSDDFFVSFMIRYSFARIIGDIVDGNLKLVSRDTI